MYSRTGIVATVLWALLSACSSPQSSEKGTNASKQGATFGPQTPNGSGTGPSGGSSNGTAAMPPAAQPAAKPPEPMSRWCAAVATTEIAKKPNHARQLANLCTTQNVPTKVFASLVTQAYAGIGKPSTTSLASVAPKTGQVSWAYGSAIKLPVDAKTHFDKAAPNQGDEALQEQSLIADGAQNVSVTSTPIASSEDNLGTRLDHVSGLVQIHIHTHRPHNLRLPGQSLQPKQQFISLCANLWERKEHRPQQ